MKAETILIVILALIAFDFVFEQVLDYVNLKSRRNTLPNDIKAFYDEDKYLKSQTYHSDLTRFSFITSVISFIFSFILLSQGVFGWIDEVVKSYIDHPIFTSLAYFAVLYLVSDLFSIPAQLYSTFVIEEKYGFNKTTPKIFVLDKLKGYALSFVLGGLLVGALLYLTVELGSNFWIVFWLVITVFMLLANMFYSSLILPLFNKLTPLEEGELKSAIEEYAAQVSFPLDNIFVIDGSKRSKKANAFFSGIGKQKKIVLYDTLINNHSIPELVSILAHEVGHFKKKHIIYGFITSILQTGLMLFIMSRMIFSQELSIALGGQETAIHLNLFAFSILFSPVSKILSIFGNVLSRKNEFEADAYAANTYDSDELQSALKKLSVDNLSNLYPHPFYVFMNYSHPPLLQRLSAIKSLTNQSK